MHEMLRIPNTAITMSLERSLAYLAIATGFFGAALGSFRIGEFHLFPARLFTGILVFFFILRFLAIPLRIEKNIRFYFYFLIFWLVYAALFLLRAPDMTWALKNYFLLLNGIVTLLLILNYLNNINQLRIFCKIWLITIPLILAIGLWEIHTGNHLAVSGLAQWENPYPDDPNYQQLQHSPTTVFSNQNDLATYLVLSFPFIIGFFRTVGTKLLFRLVAFVTLVIALYIVYITKSRANYLGAIVMSCMIVYFVISSIKYNRLFARLFFFTGLLASIFVLAIRLISLDSIYQPVLFFIKELFSGDYLVRFKLSLYVFNFLLDSYGLGLGPGGFEHHIEKYMFYTEGISNIHNWWLEILVNYGLLVFLGYAIFYFSLFWGLLSLYKHERSKDHIVLLQTCLLGLAAFPISCISSSSILGFFPQWAFLGFSLSVLRWLKSERVDANQNLSLNPPIAKFPVD